MEFTKTPHIHNNQGEKIEFLGIRIEEAIYGKADTKSNRLCQTAIDRLALATLIVFL